MSVDTEQHAIPGFVHRDVWAAQLGKCARTAKRWQDTGKIVVVYLGRLPFVDLEKTAARLRGEDRRTGRKTRSA